MHAPYKEDLPNTKEGANQSVETLVDAIFIGELSVRTHTNTHTFMFEVH